MTEYHKIQTVYLRDPATKHKTLLEGMYATPEFEYLADRCWRFDEKIDGTNIRVIWDGETVRFGGKTENAQIPAVLLARLQDLFPRDRIESVAKGPFALYGEGFGAKIQKGGGAYIPDGCDFILFDVLAGGVWLERSAVEEIAYGLECRMAHAVGYGTLRDAVEIARAGFASSIGSAQAEGLVMRPLVELLDRRGKRIIAKVKHKDFAHESVKVARAEERKA